MEKAPADNLSLFHALRRLVFILVRIVVRIFVQFARLSFTLDAVVVGVLRADKRAAEGGEGDENC